MQAFRPHPVILRLQELPDHVLGVLIDSHKVTEQGHLDNDAASDQLTA